ncbi:ankyrin repeat-containing domain protein [Pyronema omphalodes]|nr:ankyrin repeat-containing domain protein [Pyronema omphalodes]
MTTSRDAATEKSNRELCSYIYSAESTSTLPPSILQVLLLLNPTCLNCTRLSFVLSASSQDKFIPRRLAVLLLLNPILHNSIHQPFHRYSSRISLGKVAFMNHPYSLADVRDFLEDSLFQKLRTNLQPKVVDTAMDPAQLQPKAVDTAMDLAQPQLDATGRQMHSPSTSLQAETPFEKASLDVLAYITDFLDLSDVRNLSLVNKRSHTFFNYRLYRMAIKMSLEWQGYETHRLNPINSALMHGYHHVVYKLIEMGFPINHVFPKNPCVPIHNGYRTSGVGVNTLANPNIQWSILLTAIYMGRVDIVSMFLKMGAKVNGKYKIDIECSSQDNEKWGGLKLSAGLLTPLHVSLIQDRYSYYDWCSEDGLEMVQLLVKKGADINALGPHGVTPLLTHAFNYNHYGFEVDFTDGSINDLKARYLISKGAQFTGNSIIDKVWLTRSMQQFNPLMLKIIILLKDIAKDWPAGFTGISPTNNASPVHHILTVLPQSPASPVGIARYFHRRMGMHKIQSLRLLLGAGFSPNQQDEEGRSLLRYAASHCGCYLDETWDESTCFAKFLIRNGAEYNERTLDFQAFLALRMRKYLWKEGGRTSFRDDQKNLFHAMYF